jgi:cytochrome bd-type quinol oxidase subunit 2
MRRILTGSILVGWIAFLAGVVARGTGVAEHGLLYEMQLMLVESAAITLPIGIARGFLTGVIVLSLTAALWALMFALATDEKEQRERVMSLAAAFGCVLLVCAFMIVVATVAGAPQVVGMLLSIQMATLVSMLAAGGVEIAWQLQLTGSPAASDEPDAAYRVARSMAVPGFSAFGPPANDREPR